MPIVITKNQIAFFLLFQYCQGKEGLVIIVITRELPELVVSKELEISYRLNIVLIIHVVRKDILPYAACPYLILP